MMGLGAYAVVAGGLLITLWKYPGVALAGVLCMFGLEQWGQATTTFFAQHHTATNYLIGGILVLAILAQGFKSGFSFLSGYPTIGWLILVLFLYAFASTQWAPRPSISLDLWNARWPYIVSMIVLSPLLITQTRDLRSVNIGLLIIGGLLVVLLLFFVKWDHRRIVLDHELGNPLAVSSMAGMIVLVAVLTDPWPNAKLWFPVKWVLVGLSLALIVKSATRGQLLATFLACVACWPISRRLANLRQFAVLGSIVGFLGVATGWALQEFSSQQVYGGSGSRWSEHSAQEDISGRLSNAIFLVRLAFESPDTLLIGLGNSAAYDPRLLGIYPHFVPLEVLAEEGLIGFGLYVLILFYILAGTVRTLRLVSEKPSERLLLGGLAGLCLFTLLLSFKQGSLLLNLEPFMLAIMLGRYEHALHRAYSQDSTEPELSFQLDPRSEDYQLQSS